jgi:hypothetical protein
MFSEPILVVATIARIFDSLGIRYLVVLEGAHSFKLLATLDPAKVRGASPWAERFFATVERLAGGGVA